MLRFLQGRIVLLQELMAEIGILPSKFYVAKDWFQIKSSKTDRCVWSWPLVATAHLPLKHWGSFLPCNGKELSFFCRCPWPKLGFYLQHSYIQWFLLDKSCHYRQLWLALASWGPALTCLWYSGPPCFHFFGKELLLLWIKTVPSPLGTNGWN